MVWEDELKKESWYTTQEAKIKELYDLVSTYSNDLEDFIDSYIAKTQDKTEISEESYEKIKNVYTYYSLLTAQNKDILKFLESYVGKTTTDEEKYILENQILAYKYLIEDMEHEVQEIKTIVEHVKRNENEILESLKAEEKTNYDDYVYKDLLYKNTQGSLTIGKDYTGLYFDDFIEDSTNDNNLELTEWYKFLQELYEKPYKNFFLNENTVVNFKIIFRNPYTGLYTEKESIVQLSHSTSAKKSPVFGIGSSTLQASSTGVKLLAGTIVTNAFQNVPMPYLHAISYMDHVSVEDLPPLDLYIIPITKINDDGRFEVLMIQGIRFVDMKQNDNAASTGLYYAFSYFAEDIKVLDFSRVRGFYNSNMVV